MIEIETLLFFIACGLILLLVINASAYSFGWVFNQEKTLNRYIRKKQQQGKICNGEVLSAHKTVFDSINYSRREENSIFEKYFYKVINCTSNSSILVEVRYTLFVTTFKILELPK